MASDSLQTLTRVLKDRDIAFDRVALGKAYDNPESRPAIDEWVEEYLGPETLLSKDEAALYIIRHRRSKHRLTLILGIHSLSRAGKQTVR